MSATAATRLSLLAAVAFLPFASAQGCTQADPCPWVIDVDELGFVTDGEPEWNFTEGEWIQAELFNLDDVSHTVSFDGHAWTVASLEDHESAPFQVTPGTFTIRDAPTGDARTVVVYALPDGMTTDDLDPDAADKDTPGAGWVLALGALALAFVARRR